MASQTINKTEKSSKPKVVADGKSADASNTGYTTFDRKAEEMKIFLSLNPIPEEFLKKK